MRFYSIQIHNWILLVEFLHLPQWYQNILGRFVEHHLHLHQLDPQSGFLFLRSLPESPYKEGLDIICCTYLSIVRRSDLFQYPI